MRSKLWWKTILGGWLLTLLTSLTPLELLREWLQQRALDVGPGIIRTILLWLADKPSWIPASLGTLIGAGILARELKRSQRSQVAGATSAPLEITFDENDRMCRDQELMPQILPPPHIRQLTFRVRITNITDATVLHVGGVYLERISDRPSPGEMLFVSFGQGTGGFDLPPRGFRYTDVVRWHSQSPDIFALAYADSTFPNVLQASEPYRLDIVARYSGGRPVRGQFNLHMDQYGVPQFHSAVGRG